MLTIRLQRRGRKNDPSFRVILVEKKRAAKTGNVSEILGNYNARTGAVSLEGDRIKELLKNGVTVSDNIHNLLVNNKVIDGKKKNVNPKKTVEKAEAAEAPTAAEVSEAVTPQAPTSEPQAAAPEEVAAPAEGSDASPAAETKAE
ncbi:MAG TPA: 30S ribosomal protein S16 [Candidatus Paceibacterota bacterium]|nr:30S ribosomal protein S16 [Candidatus Paceibacterota bacterium]